MPRLCSSLLLLVLIASSASAVSMDWTPIGNPGNPADTQVMTDGTTGYGAVAYAYSVGTYEVTNAQYAEFLNAKAVSDPYRLYDTDMANGGAGFNGGITRSGSPGTYTYSVIEDRGDMPVNHVSFISALRFANWMNNGQASSDTETGAYTLLGGTATPSNARTVTRNVGSATIALASEDEWYKAAYYSALTTSYFTYPAGSNAQPTCSTPTGTGNHANCNLAVGDLADVGSYPGSASPYGSFDQGGNIAEWIEPVFSSFFRRVRGGGFSDDSSGQAASFRQYGGNPANGYSTIGFRLVLIPEPSTGLLVIAGLLGLAGWRRASA
jgi:formylglycine-generating enzyme